MWGNESVDYMWKLKVIMYNSYSKITGLSFKRSLFEAFKRSLKSLIKNNKLWYLYNSFNKLKTSTPLANYKKNDRWN